MTENDCSLLTEPVLAFHAALPFRRGRPPFAGDFEIRDDRGEVVGSALCQRSWHFVADSPLVYEIMDSQGDLVLVLKSARGRLISGLGNAYFELTDSLGADIVQFAKTGPRACDIWADERFIGALRLGRWPSMNASVLGGSDRVEVAMITSAKWGMLVEIGTRRLDNSLRCAAVVAGLVRRIALGSGRP